jgi:hypothetical protein
MERVVIKRVRDPGDLPPDLAAWLAERKENVLELIEFVDCAPKADGQGDMRAYAERLRTEGLARNVVWR